MEKVLNAAYGDGLLSEHTHQWRLDALMQSPVLDPARIVGDLSVRRARRPRLSDTLGRGLRVLRGGSDPTTVLPLLALDWASVAAELLVGRGLDCDIRLEDISVSRQHAQLRFRDGAWIVRDLDSTNGTCVNGTRVVRCRLLPGDLVTFGDARFLVD
jgi:hypothetical protein